MIFYRIKEIREGVWQAQYKVGFFGRWHMTGPAFRQQPDAVTHVQVIGKRKQLWKQ